MESGALLFFHQGLSVAGHDSSSAVHDFQPKPLHGCGNEPSLLWRLGSKVWKSRWRPPELTGRTPPPPLLIIGCIRGTRVNNRSQLAFIFWTSVLFCQSKIVIHLLEELCHVEPDKGRKQCCHQSSVATSNSAKELRPWIRHHSHCTKIRDVRCSHWPHRCRPLSLWVETPVYSLFYQCWAIVCCAAFVHKNAPQVADSVKSFTLDTVVPFKIV